MAGPITIDSPPPLKAETLFFRSMVATEALGRCFNYTIEVTSDRSDLKAVDVLGAPTTVHLETPDGDMRHFSGLIAGLDYCGTFLSTSKYRLVVRPWLWFLTRNANCRIFQRMAVPDILAKVFKDANLGEFDASYLTTDNYPRQEYVVQYRESDFNFVTRLMEREGIYYFFEHDADKHTLVLLDASDAHKAPPKGPGDPYELPFRAVQGTGKALEYIIDWNVESGVEPGTYSHADFDFTKARARIFASRTLSVGYQHDDLEVYDYPGGFVDRDVGEANALVRLQEHQEPLEQATGWSNAADLTVGCLFSLIDHPREDQNRAYLVTAATHRLRGHDSESGHADAEEPISTTFNAIDAKRQFRSPFSAAVKPFVRGPQTAIVVGPEKEEIWTDQYGRVKVQFHWDREGERNENSSCWIRVSQVWAGNSWGAMHIPRIGQEVIVDFLEGDPDRPVITGRVYNNVNMPPYELPKHQTRSGMKSRSTKGGFAQNANEIRFEDLKGHEDLFVHAENTHTTVVKGSQSITVGGDRTVALTGKETYSVDKTRTTTVKGDDSYFVTEGDVLEGFGKSHSNNVKEFATYTIGKNYGLDVGEKSAQASFDKSGDIGIANKKATIALAGGGSIEIKSDDGTITIKRGSTHIEIASDKITIDASAKVEIKGGSGIEASVGGSKMELTSEGATVTATLIKLNS